MQLLAKRRKTFCEIRHLERTQNCAKCTSLLLASWLFAAVGSGTELRPTNSYNEARIIMANGDNDGDEHDN